MSVREARLKPEYAAEYPGISPDVWMSAKELAKSLVERVRARRKEGLFTRTFDPTHFEFRGGDGIPHHRRHRTRSTDRSQTGPRSSIEDSPAGPTLGS
jgi:hypothetical protein